MRLLTCIEIADSFNPSYQPFPPIVDFGSNRLREGFRYRHGAPTMPTQAENPVPLSPEELWELSMTLARAVQHAMESNGPPTYTAYTTQPQDHDLIPIGPNDPAAFRVPAFLLRKLSPQLLENSDLDENCTNGSIPGSISAESSEEEASAEVGYEVETFESASGDESEPEEGRELEAETEEQYGIHQDTSTVVHSSRELSPQSTLLDFLARCDRAIEREKSRVDTGHPAEINGVTQPPTAGVPIQATRFNLVQQKGRDQNASMAVSETHEPIPPSDLPTQSRCGIDKQSLKVDPREVADTKDIAQNATAGSPVGHTGIDFLLAADAWHKKQQEKLRQAKNGNSLISLAREPGDNALGTTSNSANVTEESVLNDIVNRVHAMYQDTEKAAAAIDHLVALKSGAEQEQYLTKIGVKTAKAQAGAYVVSGAGEARGRGPPLPMSSTLFAASASKDEVDQLKAQLDSDRRKFQHHALSLARTLSTLQRMQSIMSGAVQSQSHIMSPATLKQAREALAQGPAIGPALNLRAVHASLGPEGPNTPLDHGSATRLLNTIRLISNSVPGSGVSAPPSRPSTSAKAPIAAPTRSAAARPAQAATSPQGGLVAASSRSTTTAPSSRTSATATSSGTSSASARANATSPKPSKATNQSLSAIRPNPPSTPSNQVQFQFKHHPNDWRVLAIRDVNTVNTVQQLNAEAINAGIIDVAMMSLLLRFPYKLQGGTSSLIKIGRGNQTA